MKEITRACPFCSEQVSEPSFHYIYGEIEAYMISVECPACGSKGPLVDVKPNEDNENNAIIAWNKRPIEDELMASRDAWKEIFDRYTGGDHELEVIIY